MRLTHLFVGAAACLLAISASAQPPAGGPAPKVLRYAFPVAETGFDPVQINDLYSSNVLAHIFDAPLTYDYLARPVKVVPNTVEALPQVSADGKIWTFKVRPGIYFNDDPAFKGSKRELTAADYVYSIKRHWDPKLKAPNLYFLDKRVLGMAELRAAAVKSGKFDYDREVEGIKALDKYTVQIKLAEPTPNMLYYLTYCNLSCAVAREVVEAYGDKIMEHPVGTNAFRLAQWKRSSRMVLDRNPNYREDFYKAEADPTDPVSQEIAAQLKGKRLPMIDRVEINVVEEAQPRWLAFLNQEHDWLSGIPPEYINIAIPNGKLAPNLAKQKLQMHRTPELDLAYVYFGMENPVLGGYTADKVALRRALALGFNIDEAMRIMYRGQVVPAQSVVPPNAVGGRPDRSGSLAEFNPAKAKALLDTYGYKDIDGDGYRELPNGGKLVLVMGSVPDSTGKQSDELWRKSMDKIGIRIEFKKAKWPELLRESRAGKLQMWASGWSAAIPDADTFYSLLYGPNAGQSNHARFNLPEFNALYDRAKVLPDGPERAALYEEMDKYVAAYAPVRPYVHRVVTSLSQPWVIGFRRHPVSREFWKYIDIDPTAQAQGNR
ncbi:MAG: ABC transporter substrate-binding protein [Burkholderiaceae bacterium]